MHPTSPSFGRPSRRLWLLEEDMAFLNHGSFGATPRRVLAAQDRWRLALERQPMRFMMEELAPALRAAASDVAGFVGARGDDVAFVENTTGGVNAILRSLALSPGDEVLTSDHVYPAVLKTMAYVCRRAGAAVRLAAVGLPVADPQTIIDAFARAITPATKLLVVDHIASGSALVFPIRELVALGARHGVPVLVDGAHGLGMVPLDLGSLGATWYVANCHKWLCAPKGSAVLWANPDDPASRAGLHAPVISHGFDEPFPAEFDWVGTRDFSAWLSVTEALALRRELGDARVRAHNDGLAQQGGRIVAEACGGTLAGPEAMMGSMASVLVPGFAGATQALGDRLRALLWSTDRIEIGVPALLGRLIVRVSGQLYNEQSEMERLASVLPARLARL